METEVLYVRVPLSIKAELDTVAREHGVSLSRVTSRALAVYLSVNCGREVPEQLGQLP